MSEKKVIFTLENYMELAYEFAIRNPRVIKLLHEPLSDDSVEELRQYGLNVTAYYCSEEYNKDGYENTIRELYLDCLAYQDLNHTPSTYEESDGIFNGYKILRQIDNRTNGLKLIDAPIEREDSNLALSRMKELIETRGSNNKLKRFLQGVLFKDYDAITFNKDSKRSRDPSTNRKKTINSDIIFINGWIEPKKYLQLLPQNI